MQPSDAQVRAGAVAKLKRATSLPRIKGGRRPPMHTEAASEGEKSRDDPPGGGGGDDSSKNVTSDDEHLPQPIQSERGKPEEHEQSDPPPKRKRHSRSRSRSRSKDLRDSINPSKSPPPSESSPEAKLDFLPAFDDIPVACPAPSRPVGIPAGTRLAFVPPTVPGSPTPSGAVPTLQDLQQRLGAGLFRSQSASRAAAMFKLTGVTSTSELPQPSPSPVQTSLSRSNTVTGSERAVARQRMIGRLQHRVGNQTDELTTSGGEEVVPMPPKRRRRRSRRSSSGTGSGAGGSVIVDDREPSSTSPNTPVVLTNNLPVHQYPESPHLALATPTAQLRVPPPPPPPPIPPSPPPEEEIHIKSSETHPTPVVLQQWTFELGPPRRDDVVIEDDEEPSAAESEPSIPQPSPSPPHIPPRDDTSDHANINGHNHDRVRAPHTSDAPSATTASSGDVVPVMMSSDALAPTYQQDTFPKSPFNTPLKERPRDEEEEEEIVYREEMKARRVWNEKMANGNGVEWPGGCEYRYRFSRNLLIVLRCGR